MPVRTQKLDIYQGDDFSATVNVAHDGVPVDLTDYTVLAQIRREVADEDPVIVTTITTSIPSPTTGTVMMSIAAAVTLTLTGTYLWDLQLTNIDGVITTLLRGPVVVTQEVTR